MAENFIYGAILIAIAFTLTRAHVNTVRERVFRRSIAFERLRTLLFQSQIQQKEVWIVLMNGHERISEAKVIHGIVKSVIIGDDKASRSEKILNGLFCFSTASHTWYVIEDIYALGHQEISVASKYKEAKALNYIQNIDSFTGFSGTDDKTESGYYRFLLER